MESIYCYSFLKSIQIYIIQGNLAFAQMLFRIIINQIIVMATNTDNSYYMGMNYRPTYRLNQQKKELKRKFINPFEIKDTKKDEEERKTIIHVNKNRKRVQQMLKYQNPFLKRKQSQQYIKKKRSGKDQGTINNQKSTQFLKVTKFNRLKTQEIFDAQLQDTVLTDGKSFPIHSQKVQIQVKKYINYSLQDRKAFFEKELIINTQKQSVFNHFPSQLFISPVSKTKLSFKKKNQNPVRTFSYFFPSNRSKTEIQSTKKVKVKTFNRPNTCVPRRKESKQKKVFNFDGTLQNYKIIIPERPKTADGIKKQRKYKRNIQCQDYQSVAQRCIKLKKQRVAQKIDKALKIQPWSNQQRCSPDMFDLSYSTIRGQFLQ